MAPEAPWPTGGGLGLLGTTTDATAGLGADARVGVRAVAGAGAAAAWRAAAASEAALASWARRVCSAATRPWSSPCTLAFTACWSATALLAAERRLVDLRDLGVDLLLGGVEAGLVVLGLLLGGRERVDGVTHVAGAGLEVGLLLQPGVGVAGEEGVELGAVVAVLVGLDGDLAHVVAALVELGVGLLEEGLGLADLLLGLRLLVAHALGLGGDVHLARLEGVELVGDLGGLRLLVGDLVGTRGGHEGGGADEQAGSDEDSRRATPSRRQPPWGGPLRGPSITLQPRHVAESLQTGVSAAITPRRIPPPRHRRFPPPARHQRLFRPCRAVHDRSRSVCCERPGAGRQSGDPMRVPVKAGPSRRIGPLPGWSTATA